MQFDELQQAIKADIGEVVVILRDGNTKNILLYLISRLLAQNQLPKIVTIFNNLVFFFSFGGQGVEKTLITNFDYERIKVFELCQIHVVAEGTQRLNFRGLSLTELLGNFFYLFLMHY